MREVVDASEPTEAAVGTATQRSVESKRAKSVVLHSAASDVERASHEVARAFNGLLEWK